MRELSDMGKQKTHSCRLPCEPLLVPATRARLAPAVDYHLLRELGAWEARGDGFHRRLGKAVEQLAALVGGSRMDGLVPPLLPSARHRSR